ncbi:hypothetical protein CRE_27699 [Caenorhabditis remanei]|uniref:Uncharacterized protein n=2 Tax=Caenorhabditis remanei TaxID=31234 RepID=E3MKL0_CAERE|nr:hypothetical protein CRE_27699 [Caenorhabditis remanei]
MYAFQFRDSKQKADNVLPGPMDKFKSSIPTDLEREEFKKTKKSRFRTTSVSLLKKVLLSNLLKSHTTNPKRLGISVAASKRALTGAKRKLKKNRPTSSRNGKKKSDVIEQIVTNEIDHILANVFQISE